MNADCAPLTCAHQPFIDSHHEPVIDIGNDAGNTAHVNLKGADAVFMDIPGNFLKMLCRGYGEMEENVGQGIVSYLSG